MKMDGVGEIDKLVRAIEAAPDSQTRTAALGLIQAVLAIHGEGLKHIVGILQANVDSGAQLISALCCDDLISSLLSLHDLHPESPRSRAERAVAQLRETGLSVDLLEISDGGIVKLRLRDSSQRARTVVEDTLLAAVPDTAGVVFETEPSVGFVPVSALLGNGMR